MGDDFSVAAEAIPGGVVFVEDAMECLGGEVLRLGREAATEVPDETVPSPHGFMLSCPLCRPSRHTGWVHPW